MGKATLYGAADEGGERGRKMSSRSSAGVSRASGCRCERDCQVLPFVADVLGESSWACQCPSLLVLLSGSLPSDGAAGPARPYPANGLATPLIAVLATERVLTGDTSLPALSSSSCECECGVVLTVSAERTLEVVEETEFMLLLDT